MKYGILTFHNTLNYGAQLQAFALQRVLASNGLDVEVIDYRNPAVTLRETPSKPRIGQYLKHPRHSLARLRAYQDLSERRTRFDRFARSSMRIGPRVDNQVGIAGRYGVVVVGSDQVWNPACTGGDFAYFLEDASCDDVRKVSYAASFGRDIFPAESAARCSAAIQKFDAISVREESGVKLVDSLCGRKASLVLDPTLLLERGVWAEICEMPDRGKFVFAYLVGERERTLEFAYEESKRRGIGLVAIDCYRQPRKLDGCEVCNSASIEQFLGLINDAELVVTSSFHGLALSLALEKDVRYCLNPAKGNRNSRLETLASTAGIEGCNITDTNSANRVNFDRTRRLLRDARNSSLEFIFQAVG